MEIKKIYFDMDGVLADFDRGVEELAGFYRGDCEMSFEEKDTFMWQAIKEVPNFYDKLELMPGAKEMFDAIYEKYGEKCEVLTGIPKPRRGITTAGEDKINWMHRVLAPNIKVNVVYKEDKKNFCFGKEYILIDDLAKNIESWEEFGGFGILHTSSEDTLEKIKELEKLLL